MFSLAAADEAVIFEIELVEIYSALDSPYFWASLGVLVLCPARGLAQTFSAIARVGATGSWVMLARDALRDGWDAAGSSAVAA